MREYAMGHFDGITEQAVQAWLTWSFMGELMQEAIAQGIVPLENGLAQFDHAPLPDFAVPCPCGARQWGTVGILRIAWLKVICEACLTTAATYIIPEAVAGGGQPYIPLEQWQRIKKAAQLSRETDAPFQIAVEWAENAVWQDPQHKERLVMEFIDTLMRIGNSVAIGFDG